RNHEEKPHQHQSLGRTSFRLLTGISTIDNPCELSGPSISVELVALPLFEIEAAGGESWPTRSFEMQYLAYPALIRRSGNPPRFDMLQFDRLPASQFSIDVSRRAAAVCSRPATSELKGNQE